VFAEKESAPVPQKTKTPLRTRWFHNCDKAGLARELELRDEQRVLFGQTVGYPERRSAP
jgi:hypothetical protein